LVGSPFEGASIELRRFGRIRAAAVARVRGSTCSVHEQARPAKDVSRLERDFGVTRLEKALGDEV
jgi:hypothetical protein